jgi:hypothetical protein
VTGFPQSGYEGTSMAAQPAPNAYAGVLEADSALLEGGRD